MRVHTVPLTAILAAVFLVVAPLPAAPEKSPERPLVLVLSGGGARGAAHIGVLKVLEENHVVPDMIVGTSMGAVVGGLYASGWSPEEMERLLGELDWNRVFSDRVDRNERTFRRKQDDWAQMIQARLYFDKWKPYLPGGMLGGQSLELLLRSFEMDSRAVDDFDDLPVPYRAVAADVRTGTPYLFDSGSLATAMRASMSIPGAFSPVEIDDLVLVDGGIVANLPVGVAIDLGAASIIAVDITSPLLRKGERIGSFLSVLQQVNGLLTVANRQADVSKLRAGDVLIHPELGDLTFLEFDRASEAADLGEAAAREVVDRLRAFAVSDEEWARFEEKHRLPGPDEMRVDRVRLENGSRISDPVIRSMLDIPVGEPLDTAELRRQLARLHATRWFGIIRPRWESTPDGRELVLEIPDDPFSKRGTLEVGVGLIDDFQGGDGYTLKARHQMLAVNRWGGEWQSTFAIGETDLFATQFYQPLDVRQRWFVNPGLFGAARNQTLWDEGEAVAQYQFKDRQLRLPAGVNLSNWGEVRVAAYTGRSGATKRIGQLGLPEGSENRGGLFAQFLVDTRKDVVFPRSGTWVWLAYERSVEAFRADLPFKRGWLVAEHSFPIGRFSVRPHVEYGANADRANSISDVFYLGGLSRLTGLGTRELFGDSVVFGRLETFAEVTRFDMAGIRIRVYAGATLEAGNTYFDGDPISLNSMRVGGSLYLGAKTPLGPAILAYGLTDGGRRRVYLMIGRRI